MRALCCLISGTGKTLMARQIGKMLHAREPKIINGPGEGCGLGGVRGVVKRVCIYSAIVQRS